MTFRAVFIGASLVILTLGFVAIILLPAPVRAATIAFLTLLLPIEAAGAVVSAVYLWRVYSAAGSGSWVFRMLVQAAFLKIVAAVWIAGLSILFVTGYAIPREVTAPFSLLAAYALLAPTIYYAVSIWIRRRRTGRPLPLGDDD